MSELPALADLEPRRRSGLGRGILDDDRYGRPAKRNIFTALKAHDARFSSPQVERAPWKAEVAPEVPAFVEPPALDDVPLAVSAAVLENPQREDEVAEVVTVTQVVENAPRKTRSLSEAAQMLNASLPGMAPSPAPDPAPAVEPEPAAAPRRRLSLSERLAMTQGQSGTP